jgi:hypothetical protein
VNIGAAEVAGVAADAAAFAHLHSVRVQFEAFGKSLTTHRNLMRDGGGHAAQPVPFPVLPSPALPPAPVPPGIIARASRLALRIKVQPGYNPTIGSALGIIAPKKTVDLATVKPAIRARLEAGHPVIIWKKGAMGLLELHVDRGGGTPVQILFTSSPHFRDPAPLPAAGTVAVWKYTGIFIHKDGRVGQWSNEIQIAVPGI